MVSFHKNFIRIQPLIVFLYIWAKPVVFLGTVQARREPQRGPEKTLSRGPIPPFCMSWDRDAEGVEREETWEEVSPHYPTEG